MRLRTRHCGVVYQGEASSTGLGSTSPVALLVPLLVQAVAISLVDNVSRTSSTSRNECDSGSHIAQCFGTDVVALYMTQACHLVIPIKDESLYDACDRIICCVRRTRRITSSYVTRTDTADPILRAIGSLNAC